MGSLTRPTPARLPRAVGAADSGGFVRGRLQPLLGSAELAGVELDFAAEPRVSRVPVRRGEHEVRLGAGHASVQIIVVPTFLLSECPHRSFPLGAGVLGSQFRAEKGLGFQLELFPYCVLVGQPLVGVFPLLWSLHVAPRVVQQPGLIERVHAATRAGGGMSDSELALLSYGSVT